MNYNKFQKEKACINYKNITDDFNTNYKYFGKNIILSDYQKFDNIQKRSYESHNMKITEIKYTNAINQLHLSNNIQYKNDIYLNNELEKIFNYNNENKTNGEYSNLVNFSNSQKKEDNYCKNTKIIYEKEKKCYNNIISYNKILNKNLFYYPDNKCTNLTNDKEQYYEIFKNIQEFITFKKEINLNHIKNYINIKKSKDIVEKDISLSNPNDDINGNNNKKTDYKIMKLNESKNLLLSLNNNQCINDSDFTNSSDYSNNIDENKIQDSLKYFSNKNNSFVINNSLNKSKNKEGVFSSEIYFVRSNNRNILYRYNNNFALNNNNFNNNNNYKNKDDIQNIFNNLYISDSKDILKLNNDNINKNSNNNIIDIDIIINNYLNEKNNLNNIKNKFDINDIEMENEVNFKVENNNKENNIEIKLEKETEVEIDISNQKNRAFNNIDNDKEIKNDTIKGSESEETIQSKNILNYLPCREKEQETICNYIKNGLNTNGNYSSLYISGMPGTGKTESVNRVIDILQNQSMKDSNNLNKLFQILYINGIEYSNPKNAFIKIYETIFMKKNNICDYIKSLDNFFMHRSNYDSSIYLKNPNNCHIILILDEVDLLIDKSQFLLYNIFNWTTYPNSKLMVISISNTLDLPNKLLSKVKSRMGNNKLLFKPYTKEELYKIIISQGINLKNYDQDALKLSSMKVAAVNGDLRRIIKILNKSKEIFKEEKRDLSKSSDSHIINKYHVLKACSELFDSKAIQILKLLEISEKIIVISLLQIINDNNENIINVNEIMKKQDI